MADVTIIAPTPQITAVSGIGHQAQSATEVVALPSALSPLSLIAGTIAGKDANGNFLLKTAYGNLSLQSDAALTYNSDVVIKLGAAMGAQGNNAKIISVNGQAFEAFKQPGQEETDSLSQSLLSRTSQSSSASTENTAPQPAVPGGIRAVIVSSPPLPASNTAQPQPVNEAILLKEGTDVIVHLPAAPPINPQPATLQQQTAIQIPPQQTPPEANPANATTAPTVKAQQPASEAVPTQTQSVNLPQSSEDNVQATPNPLYAVYAKQAALPASAQPDAQPELTMPSGSSPPPTIILQGQVISAAENGIVIVRTDSGIVTLKAESQPELAKLAPGANITIEIPSVSEPEANAAQPPLPSTPAPLAEIAASWSTLKDIINVINDSNTTAPSPQTSQPANGLLARLPSLGTEFLSSSLAFITAVAGGNIHKILGDDIINALKENGRSDLIQKFTGELANVSNNLSVKPEQQSQNWQATFLPFVFQNTLQQARIYIKRDAHNKKNPSGGDTVNGTRFVVEVDLSEFGGVQMDGLVRKKQANTIFDLMIRSGNEFSTEEQAEITSIYNNAAAQTGFNGTIAFQVTHDFPVKPLDDILANQTHVITA